MERPVTVVVPLVPQHDVFVPSLLQSLTRDRDLIRKVVLARSSVNRSQIDALREWTGELSKEHSIPVDLLPDRARRTAGANRNRGWCSSNSEYTAFLDADDSYAEGRLGCLVDVAEAFGSNLVLHDFWYSRESECDVVLDSWSLDDVIHTDSIFSATFPNGRNRSSEGTIPGDTNILIPQESDRPLQVGHGYAFVRTKIRSQVQFGLRYPGEDGQFCRDVLWSLGRVDYIPARLATYRRELTAERQADYRDKLTRRLRSVRDIGWSALKP